jgi:hypothetical protein
MPPRTVLPALRRTLAAALALSFFATGAVALVTSGHPAGAATSHPVMAERRVGAADLAGWFASTGKVSKATVPMDVLARYFVAEGDDEGVAGDLAFAQSIVETGYFNFSARILPSYNNFSGLGAVDGGTGGATFSSAQLGVRAQVQHLRAYADPTVTVAKLAHALIDPRFNLVAPKGKAPTWEQFGNGIWATDPGYAAKVIAIHDKIVAWATAHGTPPTPPTTPTEPPGIPPYAPFPTASALVVQGYRDLLYRDPTTVERDPAAARIASGDGIPAAFLAGLVNGESTATTQPVARLYMAAFGRNADRGGLAYWTARRAGGAKLERLADVFLASAEFRRRFGTPTDAGYVGLLYRNVLGRAADASGSSYWTARLKAGTTTRSGLLVSFSESAEHQRRVGWIVEAVVVHLGLLQAPPTLADLSWWSTQIANGKPVSTLIQRALDDANYSRRF